MNPGNCSRSLTVTSLLRGAPGCWQTSAEGLAAAGCAACKCLLDVGNGSLSPWEGRRELAAACDGCWCQTGNSSFPSGSGLIENLKVTSQQKQLYRQVQTHHSCVISLRALASQQEPSPVTPRARRCFESPQHLCHRAAHRYAFHHCSVTGCSSSISSSLGREQLLLTPIKPLSPGSSA